MHRDVIEAQAWAVHTKEVSAEVEKTYRMLVEDVPGFQNRASAGNRPGARLSTDVVEKIPARIAALRVPGGRQSIAIVTGRDSLAAISGITGLVQGRDKSKPFGRKRGRRVAA